MSRVQAACSSLLLDLRLVGERRAEARALTRAGSALYAAGEPPRAASAELLAAWHAAEEYEVRRAALGRRLEESLASDRRDYREASGAGRWLVIARGVLERLWLRERIWRERGRRTAALAELARQALENADSSSVFPALERAEIDRIRAGIRTAERARAESLAPYGGEPLPRWLRTMTGEIAQLLRALREQVERKLFLRLPGLVAVLAAWWLTRTYTSSSSLEGVLHGITGEGRAGLSSSTLERLQFWLPLLAGAVTVYVTNTLSRYVRSRYET